jgi:sulfonate transport system permease protein
MSTATAHIATAPGTVANGWLRYRRYVPPLLIVVLWQVGAVSGLISSRTLASPLMIANTFRELIVSGELPKHLLVSLGRVAIGLSIGVLAGGTLALIAGLSRRGEDLLDATMQMLRTLPFLALVPLFILWFGIGEAPKIALVALGTTFPIYLMLFAGIRGVDAKLIEAGSTLGLTQGEVIRHIVLPGALPSALVGLRYALGVAWLSLVVAEQINAESGIGYLVMTARDFLRTDIILVGLIVYAVLGLSADQIVRALEQRVLAWRPTILKD